MACFWSGFFGQHHATCGSYDTYVCCWCTCADVRLGVDSMSGCGLMRKALFNALLCLAHALEPSGILFDDDAVCRAARLCEISEVEVHLGSCSLCSSEASSDVRNLIVDSLRYVVHPQANLWTEQWVSFLANLIEWGECTA